MYRSLFAAAVLALAAPAVLAADLPVYEPAPMVAPNPTNWDWSGIYIGAHGGYGWADIDEDDGDDSGNDDGIVVGGHIGINWQWNQFVLGAEGDGSFVDIDRVDSLESLRLRGGIGFDRVLVYATGGAAFHDFDDLGWVAGGGAEVMLTPNVALGAEYLHYDFDEESTDVVRGRLSIKFSSLTSWLGG